MMNKQDILRKIGGIINELSEQHDYLSQADKINILELELFTANADFLIDHIEILKKLNDKPVSDAPAANFQPPVSAPPVQPAQDAVLPEPEQDKTKEAGEALSSVPISPWVEELSRQEEPEEIDDEQDVSFEEETSGEEEEEAQQAPSFKFDFSEEPKDMTFDFEKRIAVEEVFDRELSKEEQELIEEKQGSVEEAEANFSNEEPEIVPEPVEEKPEPVQQEETKIEVFQPSAPLAPSVQQQQQPVGDRQEPAKPKSLNEILSERNATREAASGNYSRPVADLKSAVSLNDKMIFIKELFNGYNLAYSEAIEILNRFDSFEAADNFLQKNYAEKNNWVAKQEIVDRFYDVLKRRFNKL